MISCSKAIFPNRVVLHLYLGAIMSKAQDTKKAVKKAPLKSPKEKKEAKKIKKIERARQGPG